MQKRTVLAGAGIFTSIPVLAGAAEVIENVDASVVGQENTAPMFEVDPFWPKPLPNHWILGSAVGVGVDSRDHVYIIHRGEMSLNERTEMGLGTDPPTSECCAAAPYSLRGSTAERTRRVSSPPACSLAQPILAVATV